MAKTQLVTLLGFSVALGMSQAMAGELKDEPGKPGIESPSNSRPISWEEFQVRCQDRKKLPDQLAPENVKVQCLDVHHEFVSDMPGTIPLPGSRVVLTSLFSDKFHVETEQRNIGVASKGGSCLRFKEIEKSIVVERALSCNEVLGIKDFHAFCESIVDGAKMGNPKLVEVKDTGILVDTCGVLADGGDGKGKGGHK